MKFKQFLEEDKLFDSVDKIIKKMQKEGKVTPEKVIRRVKKELDVDLDKEDILKRYTRTLGGIFYSAM